MYLEGFSRAVQTDIERASDARLIVEEVPPVRSHGTGHALRLALGRRLVDLGVHLMGEVPATRRAA